MKSSVDLIIEQLQENKLIDLNSYFAQNGALSLKDYLVAYEFSKINPILERAQEMVILNENLLDLNSEQFLSQNKEDENRSKDKIELTGNNDRSNQLGLEKLLQTTNPIIVFANTPASASYTTHSSQFNSGQLSYRLQSSQRNYPRQFAWYDMPKQNIIGLSYYKRH